MEIEMDWLENKNFRGKLSPDEHYHATEGQHWPVSHELKNSIQELPLFIKITPVIFLIINIAASLLVS
jgi:hypothetical protein